VPDIAAQSVHLESKIQLMTPSGQQAARVKACLALRAAAWPDEMAPEYPQASYYRARYYDLSTSRFLNEDPVGFLGGIDKYPYVRNSPTKYSDPLGLWPWDKAKKLDDQTAADQQMFNMTSKFLDPFVLAKCQAAVYLAQVNQLAYLNLEIDGLLQGGMAIGLLASYPELIGKPEDQILEFFAALREKNNREIDSLLRRGAKERTCKCGN
jgi:RHS repeat-associated protein